MGVLSKKRSGNRRFEYEPRYYDLTKDDRLRRRMRITRKDVPRGKKQSALTLAILFVLVLIIYLSV